MDGIEEIKKRIILKEVRCEKGSPVWIGCQRRGKGGVSI